MRIKPAEENCRDGNPAAEELVRRRNRRRRVLSLPIVYDIASELLDVMPANADPVASMSFLFQDIK